MAVAGARILIQIYLGATCSSSCSWELQCATHVAIVAHLTVWQTKLSPVLGRLIILREGHSLKIGMTQTFFYCA